MKTTSTTSFINNDFSTSTPSFQQKSHKIRTNTINTRQVRRLHKNESRYVRWPSSLSSTKQYENSAWSSSNLTNHQLFLLFETTTSTIIIKESFSAIAPRLIRHNPETKGRWRETPMTEVAVLKCFRMILAPSAILGRIMSSLA